MSSYQFVNTLAQCYAAEQAGQGAQGSQDYYNMNYPNCYSPNLAAHAQYGQYSLMMGNNSAAAAAAAAATGTGGGGGGGGGGGSGNGGNSISNDFNNPGQRGSANQSPANCKFADSSSLGSPQDLSRASDGDAAAAVAAGVAAASPKTPDSPQPQQSSPTTATSSAAAPKKERERGGDGNTVSTTNNAQSKQTSDNNGKSSTNNPPQIYPWMKRVHLGQSK